MAYTDTQRRTASTLDCYLADVRDKPLLSATEEVDLALGLEAARIELCRHLARVPWSQLAVIAAAEDLLAASATAGMVDGDADETGRTERDEPRQRTQLLLDDIREVDRLRQRRDSCRRRSRRTPRTVARHLVDGPEDDVQRELRIKLDAVVANARELPRLLERIDRALDWARRQTRSSKPGERKAARERVTQALGTPTDRLARLRTDARRALRTAQGIKDRMVEANLRLVLYHAKRVSFPGVAMSDVVQEGNLGLMRAVDKFNPRLGYRFSTYASWWIRQAITRAVPEQARSIRLPVHVLELQRRIRRASQSLQQQSDRAPTAAEVGAHIDLSATRVAALEEAAHDAISLDMPLSSDTERTIVDTIAGPEDDRADAAAERDDLAAQTRKLLDSLPPREALVLRLRFGVDARAPHTLQQIGDLLGVTRERARQIEAKALRKLQPGARRQALAG
ncbi:MAG: sigma-70 family RNA polymerase sigma factor [Deltaproteobacteria bacterium]|jgi:RNA polymerase primary sigma factor|nr:sigma-70 family RNA polymerase sigma factor [Deltaproteobacteria bacterium]MBW2534895.1 sigma-70 family RNA polymerase sigma factor [Deltaproteobacteria bacterium]